MNVSIVKRIVLPTIESVTDDRGDTVVSAATILCWKKRTAVDTPFVPTRSVPRTLSSGTPAMYAAVEDSHL
jgi:hypothetical protein